MDEMNIDGYEDLADVLRKAYRQAALEKGRERHAKHGEPFCDQHMQTISRALRSDRGMAYQVCKKVIEGIDLPDHHARERELLGAIVYIAGMVIYHRNEPKAFPEEPAVRRSPFGYCELCHSMPCDCKHGINE